MRRTADDEAMVRQHSGWLIPLGLLAVIVLLCAIFLGFYLRPSAFRSAQLSPTASQELVTVWTHGRAFAIPANYFAYAPDRSGGARGQIALIAMLPGLGGYSEANAALFAGDAPDSPILYMLIREDRNNLSEADRLVRIYMPYIADPAGTAGPFGLTQYGFRDDSGYRNNDLFVGHALAGAILFLCARTDSDVPSPNCLAIDRPVAKGVALSYRFKRTYLGQWRAIADGVAKLTARFEAAP